jgi:hypothetical protein
MFARGPRVPFTYGCLVSGVSELLGEFKSAFLISRMVGVRVLNEGPK